MLIAFGRGGARRSDVARAVGKRCVGEVNRYTAKDYYGKQLEEKDECFFISFPRTDAGCTINNDKQQLKIG